MANQAHLEILAQGVQAWNRWRQEKVGVRPDLSGARLSGRLLSYAHFNGADLGGVDLSSTELTGAVFNAADLRRADLRRANLTRAYLGHADLSRADLRGAQLSDADLSRANLRDADLGGAILIEAHLREANLRATELCRAHLHGTLFTNVDLREVKSLENCEHGGPSSLDVKTLLQSGNLPVSFLRGCGLPDDLIAHLPSLRGDPIQYYSCFISYSSVDDEFAKRLHADLQDNGVRCWFALEDMKIGDKIRAKIDESIRIYDKLLLVLSEKSVASEWVEKEVETAFEKERKSKKTCLFPVRLDETVMETDEAWAADIRRTRHIGDFRDWKDHEAYQKAFERLVRDLKKSEA